ncbi:TAXI family TRAP transporter solute-binding subunit [Natranaerofaba carboxydovora]|uniref:TAXI family TRAP transporter solute-binding subunit n=1 Tax=Natranaerofaba carboxydovora TaxID=2742683 RepID=UPI001F142581|nr:TAXI family TRAP transporter solute-binding subunit [Natranaerofaba carboxydovora]UMZ72712.1 NMT1-like family protein [Natranaerofaba carboxydovora]
MTGKKSLVLGVFLIAILLTAAFIGGCGDAAEDRLVLATGGTGGVYYPLGGAMASIWSEEVDGVEASSESTGASVENVNLVDALESELALVQNDITYYAYNGTEMFEDEEQMEGLRGIASLYPEEIQIIADADADVETVEDLEGKRVGVGDSGSGTEANARQILEMHDITYDDIEEDYLDFDEAADNIRDGHADAAFVTGGVPTGSVTDLATTTDIDIVGIEQDKIDDITDEWEYYAETTIPADSYSGQEEDVQSVAVMAMMIAHESLDEDAVYEMTKALFENTDALEDSHDRGGEVELDDALEGMPIELHPGAERYFEEEGIN